MSARRRSASTAGTAVALALAIGLAVNQSAMAVSAALPAVVSDDPINTSPNVLDGTVLAVAEIGDVVVAGGDFSSVSNAGSATTIKQANLIAYNKATGAVIKAFDPALDGSVETVVAAAVPGAVIVGGSFRNVNGVAQRGLVMLNLADGSRIASFSATTDNTVRKVLVRGNRLIVGGEFGTIGGVAREHLAIVNANTGAVESGFNVPVAGTRKPDVNPASFVYEMDATTDGAFLVIVGNFLTVGGRNHNQVAIINLQRNAVTPWRSPRTSALCGASVSFFFSDVEIAPTNDWFAMSARGGYASPANGGLCDTVSRWSLAPSSTSAQPTWVNYTGGDTLWSVAVTSAAVYVGGHQRWLNNPYCSNCAGPTAVSRPGVGAVSPSDGGALAWNPGRTRGVGAQELVATTSGLYIGSDTIRLGGEYHARLGLFPAG